MKKLSQYQMYHYCISNAKSVGEAEREYYLALACYRGGFMSAIEIHNLSMLCDDIIALIEFQESLQ